MPKFGWKHPVTGEHIDPTDGRLVGMGNPPCIPGPVGHGQIPLTPVVMTDAQAAKAATDKAKHEHPAGQRVRSGFPEWKDAE